MIQNDLTLRQISDRILSDLVCSRTDFLLLQAQAWQRINDTVTEHTIAVQPNPLDIERTSFEFFIAQRVPNVVELVSSFLRKTSPKKQRFKLCSSNEKNGIKVTITVRLQSGALTSAISTEPDLAATPEEIIVRGVGV